MKDTAMNSAAELGRGRGKSLAESALRMGSEKSRKEQLYGYYIPQKAISLNLR